MKIESFSGAYRFLSNFYIEPDGTCVEVEYQMAKCADNSGPHMFDGLSPGQAKRLGRIVALRSNWEEVKLGVMFELVEKKFTDHANLRQLLLDTQQVELVEGNNWGDRFWGVCRGEGENHLGRILMDVRELLKR